MPNSCLFTKRHPSKYLIDILTFRRVRENQNILIVVYFVNQKKKKKHKEKKQTLRIQQIFFVFSSNVLPMTKSAT